MSRPPRVSVIVPTYRDWDALEGCVEALARQTLPREEFELILVDNDAAGQPPPWLQDWQRYLHWPQGHSYAARNAGVRAARADILVFTDADCLPVADWLRAGLAVLEADPEIRMVAGRVEMTAARRNVFAEFDITYGIPQESFVRSNRGAATANLFVRKQVFASVGNFVETLESGGDLEFCRRATRAGHRLVYSAEAAVLHPARDTFTALYRKSARVARGRAQLALREAAGSRRALVVSLLRPFKPRWQSWRKILRGGTNSSLGAWGRVKLMLLRIFLQYQSAVVQGSAMARMLWAGKR